MRKVGNALCINGDVVFWATRLVIGHSDKRGIATSFHLVLFPTTDGARGIVEFRVTEQDVPLFCELGPDSPIQTFCFHCLAVEMCFTPHFRQNPSCLCKSLHIALKHLKHWNGNDDEANSANQPRIGALDSEQLTQIIVEEIGVERSSIYLQGTNWLAQASEISLFPVKVAEDASMCCCVARKSLRDIGEKKGKNSSFSGKEGLIVTTPRLASEPQRGFNTEDLVKEANCDGICWRKAAASFSTMMRYFQKSKSDFCWISDDDSKTIIRIAKGL